MLTQLNSPPQILYVMTTQQALLQISVWTAEHIHF